MSSQMFDADNDAKISYNNFRDHAARIHRQQGIDLNKLN
jgi:Ca2+-binding EF-hand superfamily protein